MKLKLFSTIFILVFILIGCREKRINTEIIPHTKLLNLKGNVEQIHFFRQTFKLTENGYINDSQSSNSNNWSTFFFRDTNIFLNLLFNGFDSNKFRGFTDKALLSCLNPNDIIAFEIWKDTGTLRSCSDIKLTFNKEGFIEKFEGYDKGKQIFIQTLLYDDKNRLIQSNVSGDTYPWKGINKYEYHSNGLISCISELDANTNELESITNFNYQDKTDKIAVTISTYNSKWNENSSFTSYIITDTETEILKECFSDSLNIHIYYNGNGLVKHVATEGESIEYIYNNTHLNNIIIKGEYKGESIKSDHYRFEYNIHGNINRYEINNNLGTSDVANYEYDSLNNWTKLTLSINNRWVNQIFGNMQECKKIRNEIEFDKLYNIDYSDKYARLQYLKEQIGYGSVATNKIVIDRVIKYYEK